MIENNERNSNSFLLKKYANLKNYLSILWIFYLCGIWELKEKSNWEQVLINTFIS